MELIGLFVLVLILTIAITLAYLRFMNYMEKHHPSYIGAGLRSRFSRKHTEVKELK